MGVDGRDDLTVHLADEHHGRDLEGLGVGDAQTIEELGLLAEALHHVADLRTATVHDHGTDPERVQKDDVVGERLHQVVVDHGVAAELHDDRRAAELADVRQRLDEHLDCQARIAAHDVPMFSSTYAWVRSLVSTEPRPGTQAEVTVDLEVTLVHVRSHRRLVVIDLDTALAHGDAAVADRHETLIERDTRAAELARDAPPVRVLAVPRALDQLTLGDLARGPLCVLVGVRAGDRQAHDLGSPFGITGHLAGEIVAGGDDRGL